MNLPFIGRLTPRYASLKALFGRSACKSRNFFVDQFYRTSSFFVRLTACVRSYFLHRYNEYSFVLATLDLCQKCLNLTMFLTSRSIIIWDRTLFSLLHLHAIAAETMMSRTRAEERAMMMTKEEDCDVKRDVSSLPVRNVGSVTLSVMITVIRRSLLLTGFPLSRTCMAMWMRLVDVLTLLYLFSVVCGRCWCLMENYFF